MSMTHQPGAPATAPRVFFCTHGCRLNQHDTAAMRAALTAAGWSEAGTGERADVVVVNTCTVTARADQEARQSIRRVAREHPGARIVVTGCYAQRAPEELALLPGVTDVIGTAERDRIAERLGVAERDRTAVRPGSAEGPAIEVAPARVKRPFSAPAAAPLSFGRTRALLQIQDGCDAFCSYCIVPHVRGRSRSLPFRESVARARRLIEAGFHEIVLTGADLGDYGSEASDAGALPRLVEAILSLGSGHRVRISSIEPNKVHGELVRLAATEPRFCRHLHLPLQSGSAAVLRAMRRGYAPEQYAALVERLAASGPIGIGADAIVGFPAEGEEEFEETCRFLERLPITYLHVFRYSPRPGTRAALDLRRIDPTVVRRRAERLRALGDAKRDAFHAGLVGRVLPCLVEGAPGEGPCLARSDLYAPVRLERRPAAGGILPVRVCAARNGLLEGELESEEALAAG